MNVKLFTVMVALLSMPIIACDPSDENDNNETGGIPPLDEWWKRIEGGGEIYASFRYKIEDGGIRILRYEGAGGTVTIPAEIEEAPVTTIGIYAFRETKLTDVVIPNSVNSIENAAFLGNQLTNVVIPDSVTSIGDGAFCENQLYSVVIPDSVTSIGNSVFGGNRLISVVIPDSVTSIGEQAFQSNRLTSVIIPDNVTSIGKYAFYGNRLTGIKISDNVTRIALYTFGFNYGLTKVVIPNRVAVIELGAFSGIHTLVEITIGKNVSINSEADIGAFDRFQFGGYYEPSGFVTTYNNNGRLAGTYTRTDMTSNVWTRQ